MTSPNTLYETQRQETYLCTYAPSKDLGQPVLSYNTAHMVKGHRKTCLYSVVPLKPHFYIVKLAFTWIHIFFLISAQIQRLLVLVRTDILKTLQQTCYILFFCFIIMIIMKPR